jgi:hypothetical protein
MAIHQQGFSEFNSVVKLPRPVTPEIFTTSIHRAIGLIEVAAGATNPLVEYLRREPPVPMFDKDGWKKHLGRIITANQNLGLSQIEVRPDLVFYPLMMVSVLIHEATHALDPLVGEAVQVAEELEKSTENQQVFQERFFTWKEMERNAELRAVAREIEILPRLVVPKGALEEQARYFTSQRAAVVAMRTVESAHLEAGIAVLQFSRGVNVLLDDGLQGISDQVVSKTQELLKFLLDKPTTCIQWADNAVAQLLSIINEFGLREQLDYRVEHVLQNTSNTLENCRQKFNKNVWLASKVKMPFLDL